MSVLCRPDAASLTKTCLTGAFALSTATRKTSKKPTLCGPLPVARDPPRKLIYGLAPNAPRG